MLPRPKDRYSERTRLSEEQVEDHLNMMGLCSTGLPLHGWTEPNLSIFLMKKYYHLSRSYIDPEKVENPDSWLGWTQHGTTSTQKEQPLQKAS